MRELLKTVAWPAIAGLLAALLFLERSGTLPSAARLPQGAAVESYADAVSRASPAVVNIYTRKLVTLQRPLLDRLNRRLPRQREERSLGSGVIMSAEGYILTNHHVIAGADDIVVQLQDGRNAVARVVGSDIATDLAVLQVDLPDLQPIEAGTAETARVGDVVLAIGNPLGFGHSVTQGIISALGRYTNQPNNVYEDYIQTDASIHQGNSGGALIDTRGRLLGINSLFIRDQGSSTQGVPISLAVPVELAVFVMNDLIEYGQVIRGWLGVSVALLSLNEEGRQVLRVDGVAPGSPAEQAGVMLGDYITHINGELIRNGRRTMQGIAMLRPGETIEVTVDRGQQSLTLRAVVGTLGQPVPASLSR